jgi:glycosyltransferase involved in cell wall biosynthesis
MEKAEMGDGSKSTRLLDSGRPDVTLILPCFDEEDSLRGTVMRLARAFRDIDVEWELVLVDNGSTDGTGQVIDELTREGLPIVKQTVQVNQGYGNGVLQGLRVARGRLVGFSVADAQVEAQDVARLFDIARNARSPKLFKVRRRFRTEGLPRMFISLTYNLFARILFGSLGTGDINAVPKILPREIFDRMDLQSKDWFLDAELVLKARQMRLGIYEMNVFAQMRAEGSSNVRLATCWEFVVNLLKYRFGNQKRLALVKPLEPAHRTK